MRKGLLGIEELSRSEIESILDRAKFFQPPQGESFRRVDTLRGRMVVNLFFEASTRTRVSFEIAAKRLGADAVSITAQGSSVSKGESLVDTLNTLIAMRPDAIVMRHSASGAPHFLARHLPVTPIVNAGDGTHEHPTQALLDARTILDHTEQLDGLRVAIIGDIAHSRVARSNIHLLSKFGADIVLCGPPPLLPPDLARIAPGVTLSRGSMKRHFRLASTSGFTVCVFIMWISPNPTQSSCTPARLTAAARSRRKLPTRSAP
jgi:aspartate carbamoyltransferase catalytic subunit